MALEALHLLPTKSISISITIIMTDAIDINSDRNYRLQHHPLSGTTTTTVDNLLPMYSSIFTNTDPLKTETDLTYNLHASRKRSRYFSSMFTFSDALNVNRNPVKHCTILGQDISSQIQQQQFEIDQFIARQNEKLRTEIEEKRRRSSMKLMAAMEEGITQRLRAKEEEITKMMKLNCALEDKLKSVCIENEIWRELAQTNEATANALRSNLKQVLEQVVDGDYRHHNTTVREEEDAVVADDALSCCESNNGNERMLAEHDSSNNSMKRLCKKCGEAESCVLLLPCRHLCVCTVCVSGVDVCPVCKSTKKMSVHVHIS